MALSLLSANAISNLFSEQKVNDNGCYTICLHKQTEEK